MDLFEFILIITSVIYALAVAQILSGVSRLVQTNATIRWYLPHAIWTGTLFVYIFLVWWSAWEFRELDWQFPEYLFMVIAPTLLYLTCSLLIPQHLDERSVDLEAHFYKVRRPLLWSFLLATVAAVSDGNVLAGEPIWFDGREGHIAVLLSTIAGLSVANRKAQTAIAVAVASALMYVMVTRLWNPR
jgi:hypothetical protein